MRRRLLLLTGATTALVLAALLVPLTLLTRTHAADRATAEATARAQWVASAVGPVLADGARGAAAAEQTVRSANGAGLPRTSLILAGGAVVGAPAQVTDAVRLARTGRAFTYELSDGGRVVLVPVHGAPDGTAVVQVALSSGQLRDGVLASWLVLAGIGAGLVLLGLVLADRLGARLVSATRSLAKTADRLAAGDLTARAEPAGPPELRLIGDQLNRLATRIDELLAAERENAADLAHRLRTPVAALRLDAETLRDPAEAERITTGVAALEQGVDEVIRRARRPLRETEPSCDLSTVARERTAFWLPLAEDQDRAVEIDTPPGPLHVPVPTDELAAVLDALIGNVLDHTPQGTGFRVTVRTAGGPAELLVEDEGPGFTHGGGPHPTVRGTSGAGSTGLGLDIARRTAEEAGGTFTAESAPGARVTLAFPKAAGRPPAPASDGRRTTT
ncbi:sensor histidine kinase [Streptomyces sporangiiformans]|uniref:histidine kinase n=1 Tax=Streptomyces sporangiiformans TaxID=2315329 RepID=A0A505DID3_9ACTN|nr:HAMP domain-containing sensor histidine kinase [Streptomyces sporangiiformans]TPQ22642.1 HAMP domain-containing histidine kinase [Streptomyces sporangiiformans]